MAIAAGSGDHAALHITLQGHCNQLLVRESFHDAAAAASASARCGHTCSTCTTHAVLCAKVLSLRLDLHLIVALVDAAVAALRLDVVLLNVGTHWSRYWLPAIAGGVERRLGAAHAVCMSRGIDLDLHLLNGTTSGPTRQLLLTSMSA